MCLGHLMCFFVYGNELDLIIGQYYNVIIYFHWSKFIDTSPYLISLNEYFETRQNFKEQKTW